MFKYLDLPSLVKLATSKNEPALILVLDGIEDPHNLGAILRTVEASGVDGVVLRKRRQVQVNETVLRVSTGAAQKVAVARVPNIAEALTFLKNEGIVVIGLEIDGKKLYNEIDLMRPVALVIGSEGSGLARLVKERCDEVVRIPMRGEINSLNASVATGVILFETLRQRR